MPSRKIWSASLALLCINAQADSLLMKNGDRLSGTIESLDQGTLVFSSRYAGTLKLPWAEIEAVESDKPLRLRLEGGNDYSGRLVTENGEARVLLADLDGSAPLALARVKAINPPLHPDRTRVTGHVNVGGNFTRGNTDSSSLHLAGKAVARNPGEQLTLNAELNEAEQNGVNSASNWLVGLQYDHFLDGPKNYLYLNTGFAQDRRTDLTLRSTLGAGGGRYLVERDGLTLSAEAGLSLVNEDYGSAPDTRFPGLRLALRYDQKFFDGRLALFHTSEVLANLEDAEDTLYLMRTGVRLPMSDALALTTQLNFDYDNVPAAGKKTTDTALILGIDYSLK